MIERFAGLSYPVEEAINTLCTNLSFSGENVKKIMVTSSHADEGKSFVTMNIMRTMARLGKDVAFVDGDLRKSVVTSKYGLRFEENSEKKGLAHYLAGMAEESEVIYRTNIQGAYMVPVGRDVQNALPLLNSPRLGHLLDTLAENVDYVLVDAAPVGTVIDAAQIAKSCDGVLIVVNYNSVRYQELLDVKEQLEATGCPILGTVLNKVEYDSYLSKKYYYKSYYSYYEQGAYGNTNRTKENNKKNSGKKK